MTNVLIGLLGVVFVTIARMYSLQKDAETANIEFSYATYFKREALGIALSLLSVWIWYYLYPEAAAKYTALENWIRFSFLTSGAIGAWALQKALGRTKGWIRGIVDEKTNIADKLQP